MPRVIPHDHRCPICGTTEGHEDKFCQVTELYKVCERPECQRKYAGRTVHQAPTVSHDVLPCCGILKSSTPIGDTMTTDANKVTCKGASATYE